MGTDQAELRSFAEQWGFEGGDQEWLQEFRLLCGTCGTNGFSMEVSVAMLNDTSKDGMYCPDTELVAILRALRSRQASAARGRARRDQASGTRARLAAKLPTPPAVKEPPHDHSSLEKLPQAAGVEDTAVAAVADPASEFRGSGSSLFYWVKVCVGYLVQSYRLQFFCLFSWREENDREQRVFPATWVRKNRGGSVGARFSILMDEHRNHPRWGCRSRVALVGKNICTCLTLKG